MSEVVVVGAGLAGLAVAARLAATGHRVAVFEAAATVGGKLGVLQSGGFTFDTGPSLVTVPDVLTDLFADTGGPADLPLTRVDPASAYRFADGTDLVLPHDPRRGAGRARCGTGDPGRAHPGSDCTTAPAGCGISSENLFCDNLFRYRRWHG